MSPRPNSALLNWLRASVLGANDGIVSVASIIVGVAGATTESGTIMLAGVAGTVAGAFSMAAGEYVSVSAQRDAEHAYHTHTLSSAAHTTVNEQLHEQHKDIEFTNPWHAAVASAVSFFAGAALPLFVAYTAPAHYTVPATFLAVIISLSITGYLSAHVGKSNKLRATTRLILGGTVAMTITYAVGALFGVNVV